MQAHGARLLRPLAATNGLIELIELIGFGISGTRTGSLRRLLRWKKVYRFFTDLTGIFGHPIKFFGFDWVRLGSIPAWF
jgi:hypothetical protein